LFQVPCRSGSPHDVRGTFHFVTGFAGALGADDAGA